MKNALKRNCGGIQETLTNAVAATVFKSIQPLFENLEKQNTDLQNQLDNKAEEVRDLKANAEKMTQETNQKIKLLEKNYFVLDKWIDAVNNTVHGQVVISTWFVIELKTVRIFGYKAFQI